MLRYGEPRLTKDIDITVGLEPNNAKPVLNAISELGFRVLVDDIDDFLRQTFVLPAADPQSGLRVDFIFSLSEYERCAIGRAPLVDFDGVGVRFVSPEDLVIHKIIAGRPRDLDDVRSVLLKNPDLCLTEIRKWLREYDTEVGENFEPRFLSILDECKLR